jgi:hypothetical protein
MNKKIVLYSRDLEFITVISRASFSKKVYRKLIENAPIFNYSYPFSSTEALIYLLKIATDYPIYVENELTSFHAVSRVLSEVVEQNLFIFKEFFWIK